MRKIRKRFRDWWRGWSDNDLANALNKVNLSNLNPGAITYLTTPEYFALQAYQGGYRLSIFWPTLPEYAHGYSFDRSDGALLSRPRPRTVTAPDGLA